MNKWLVVVTASIILICCDRKSSKNGFEVSGTITNNTAKMIYLEEIPVATMQRVIIDSLILNKDRSYKLKGESKEASFYNLRLDKTVYPLAAIINDTPKI